MLAYCLTLLSFFNINLTHSPVLSNLLTLHLVTPFTFLFFHLTFLNILYIYLEDFFVNQVFILNFKFLGCNWKMMNGDLETTKKKSWLLVIIRWWRDCCYLRRPVQNCHYCDPLDYSSAMQCNVHTNIIYILQFDGKYHGSDHRLV